MNKKKLKSIQISNRSGQLPLWYYALCLLIFLHMVIVTILIFPFNFLGISDNYFAISMVITFLGGCFPYFYQWIIKLNKQKYKN